jgi:2-polyprenyl-3-methyl-5-hydroxy-6-metoxy-1,4-benzoquinol methylase
MKRFKAEQEHNVPQYRAVLRSLEQHLRAGSLVASDFGRSPPARLGAMIAANPRQQDVCAAPGATRS